MGCVEAPTPTLTRTPTPTPARSLPVEGVVRWLGSHRSTWSDTFNSYLVVNQARWEVGASSAPSGWVVTVTLFRFWNTDGTVLSVLPPLGGYFESGRLTWFVDASTREVFLGEDYHGIFGSDGARAPDSKFKPTSTPRPTPVPPPTATAVPERYRYIIGKGLGTVVFRSGNSACAPEGHGQMGGTRYASLLPDAWLQCDGFTWVRVQLVDGAVVWVKQTDLAPR